MCTKYEARKARETESEFVAPTTKVSLLEEPVHESEQKIINEQNGLAYSRCAVDETCARSQTLGSVFFWKSVSSERWKKCDDAAAAAEDIVLTKRATKMS